MTLSQSNRSCLSLANQYDSILTNQRPGAGTAVYITEKRGAHVPQLDLNPGQLYRSITEPGCWRGAAPQHPPRLPPGPEGSLTAALFAL